MATEDSRPSPPLDMIRRQRAHRRGQVTICSKKLAALYDRTLRDTTVSEGRSLLRTLQTEVEKQQALQDLIDDAVAADIDALESEFAERERDADINSSLVRDVETFIAQAEAYDLGRVLADRLQKFLNYRDHTVYEVRDELKKLQDLHADFCAKAALHPRSEELANYANAINNILVEAVAKMPRMPAAPIATSPPATTSTPERPPLSRMAPINVDIAKFNGDPLSWANFEALFSSTLRTRAESFSEADKRAILATAIQHPEGRKILEDDPTATVDDCLAQLRQYFGRAEVVVPLLLDRILNLPTVTESFSSVQDSLHRVVRGHKALTAHIGNSLSEFLTYLIGSRLDPQMSRDWRLHINKIRNPTLETWSEFANGKICHMRPSAVPSQDVKLPTPSSTNAITVPQYMPSPTSSLVPTSPSNRPFKPRTSPKCAACGESHLLNRCPTFIALDVDKRNKTVRDRRLCVNCFSDKHTCRLCPSKFSCRHCGGRHHSLLHRDRETAPTPAAATTNAAAVVDRTSTQPSTTPPAMDTAFPNTVVVSLENGQRSAKARAMFDSGAGASLMTEELASNLKLKRYPQPMSITCTSGRITSKFYVVTPLYSHSKKFQTKPINFIVVPSLITTVTPTNRDDILKASCLTNAELADPSLGGPVDIFIGVSDIDDCVTESPKKVDGLRLIKTPFGLSVSGPCTSKPAVGANAAIVETALPDDLNSNLSRLWELDQVPEAPSCSADDAKAVRHFHDTIKYVNGRFSVSLPHVSDAPTLGDSRKQAYKRLLSNERSLLAKDKLEAFNNVLREYIDLGHAHFVPADQLHNSPSYYLPVHGVFKDSSSTTKCRAVFDASAVTSSGKSLNDTLLTGPNLYPPLTDVLVKFRLHPIGLSADISKMFREVALNPEHRDLHRFLMRDTQGTIRDCRMERLTFGINCSPFIATQVLHHLADLHSASHPQASSAILTTFYVDDFLSGADTVEEADHLWRQLCELLSRAGMTLRKWRTNSPEVRAHIPPTLLDESTEPLTIAQPQDSPKALGIHWDTEKDSLHVAVPPQPDVTIITKRTIASGTAAVFDVLGLFCPTIIQARIILQETWKRDLPWDKPVPEDIEVKWKAWLADLPTILAHPIPRRLSNSSSSSVSKTLHGFCDASTLAYGAAIYLRTTHEDGSISVSLVTAKARVAPVKPITIPKAELLGAHLLAKLLRHTADILGITQGCTFAWTDSEIVLYWLPKHPSQLDRFVANRVHAIQDLISPRLWKHVRSQDNPADLASRGMNAPDLVASTLWWSGPPWLSSPPTAWPFRKLSKPSSAICAATIKPSTSMSKAQSHFLDNLWSRFASFHKLVRIIAWIRRLRAKPPNCDPNCLNSTEISQAKAVILKLSQLQSLPDAFNAALSNSALSKANALHKFGLSISDQGYLQICSRVRDTSRPSQPSKLIPLSPKSSLTRLLVSTLHVTYSHAGISALHSIIVSTYYIPNLRNLLKLVSRQCPACQRAYAKPLAHAMGMLPSSRTTPAPPFDRTGVDFAGPFVLRLGHTRKPVLLKTYATVFVCLTTKAVHLDLCASLSTEDFMATFRRFVARRGCPSHMYSDNGTNFLGAREEIRELQKLTESKETTTAISTFTQKHNITWHNIPPRAPHFGGLWEAAVKSMKTLLRKNLQPHALRFDELTTILQEVEAILNSRPLQPLHSDEAAEGAFLTPGHFLVGRPLIAPPTPGPPGGKMSNLRRWNLTSRLTADLWRQWSASYLASCAQRTKWLRAGKPPAVGDVVFIKDETLKTRDWPLARIEEVHPGDDGEVRAVTIRCHGRTYVRPTCRIIPFHSEDHPGREDDPSTQAGRMSGT